MNLFAQDKIYFLKPDFHVFLGVKVHFEKAMDAEDVDGLLWYFGDRADHAESSFEGYYIDYAFKVFVAGE